MGTKNNPGKWDCYARAEPDEPMFTLLGRDPHAAGLVELWAALRAQDERAARRLFEKMLECAAKARFKAGDTDKIVSAHHVADAMRGFHKARGAIA